MRLALVLPSDYRQPAVLVHLRPGSLSSFECWAPVTEQEWAAIQSHAIDGGAVLPLRDRDDTARLRRPR